MKVPYTLKIDHQAEVPKKRMGAIPRWTDVLKQFPALAEKGGVMHIAIPRSMISKEIKSLRNAVSRWRSENNIRDRFHIHAEDTGLAVWAFTEEELKDAEKMAKRFSQSINQGDSR